MRIVLFGIGKVFEKIKIQIDFKNVVGIIDNDVSKRYQRIYGFIVTQVERITELEYDYVVICNTRAYSQMREQLMSLGVNSGKIVGWRYYLYYLKYNTRILSRGDYNEICACLRKLNISTVLDIDSGVEKNAFYTGDTRLSDQITDICIYSEEDSFNPNIYDGTEKNLKKIDMVLFLDYFLNHSVEELYVKIKTIADKTQYILVSIPYDDSDILLEWAEADLGRFGEISVINGEAVRQVIVKLTSADIGGDGFMYIVAHKEFQSPKDSFYKSIYVGEYEPAEMDALKDSDGENIAILNEKINELTAIYWVWKNTHSGDVGVCHYRRYFGRCPEIPNPYFGIVTREQAQNCLNDVDMVVANTVCTYPLCVADQLKDTLNADAYKKCFELYIDKIEKVCPEYLETFYAVMDGIIIYPCNMFYTHRQTFDQYCSWLFPIVIGVAEKMDVNGYDSYSKRVVGFFAERMLTVWILHNHIKVAEMEVISILD